MPYRVNVDTDIVNTGLWKDVCGKVVQAHGTSGRPFIIYVGTCPSCGKEAIADCVDGTYADPEYPTFCPNCGAKIIQEISVEDVAPVIRAPYRKEGNQIRCLACGEHWNEQDMDGTYLPLSFCPNCGAHFLCEEGQLSGKKLHAEL